ncbi:unnamed protein product, partial [Lampetra planeri]
PQLISPLCQEFRRAGGPRIKHVCRAASVVLGQPRALGPLEQTPPSVLAALAHGFEQRDVQSCKPTHKIRVDFKWKEREVLRSRVPLEPLQDDNAQSFDEKNEEVLPPVSGEPTSWNHFKHSRTVRLKGKRAGLSKADLDTGWSKDDERQCSLCQKYGDLNPNSDSVEVPHNFLASPEPEDVSPANGTSPQGDLDDQKDGEGFSYSSFHKDLSITPGQEIRAEQEIEETLLDEGVAMNCGGQIVVEDRIITKKSKVDFLQPEATSEEEEEHALPPPQMMNHHHLTREDECLTSRDQPHLRFEISSDDGFNVEG